MENAVDKQGGWVALSLIPDKKVPSAGLKRQSCKFLISFRGLLEKEPEQGEVLLMK